MGGIAAGLRPFGVGHRLRNLDRKIGQRRIDLGEPPPLAAERGTRQVFFAVVATTVVLLSVFLTRKHPPGKE